MEVHAYWSNRGVITVPFPVFSVSMLFHTLPSSYTYDQRYGTYPYIYMDMDRSFIHCHRYEAKRIFPSDPISFSHIMNFLSSSPFLFLSLTLFLCLSWLSMCLWLSFFTYSCLSPCSFICFDFPLAKFNWMEMLKQLGRELLKIT